MDNTTETTGPFDNGVSGEKKKRNRNLLDNNRMLINSCEQLVERTRERFAERNLAGMWYVNGDPDKRAEIVSTGSGLEARNEKGEASRVSVESSRK
jgi:hypothetical protein